MLSLTLHLSSQDYDLCENCYSTTTHEHPLEKLGFSIGGDDDQPSKQNTAEARNQLIKKRNEYLIHACSCRDSSCTKPFCIKMKQLLRHARDCRLRLSGNCTACNFFIRLCASHAHECKEAKCPVPVCANLKKKMRERRQRQIAELARRRINQMRTISSSPTNKDGSGSATTHKQPYPIDVNLQNVFQALVNGYPHDSFKAREYLRKHTTMVPRIMDMLCSANKLSEATQLQQFLHTQPQLLYNMPPSHSTNLGDYNSPSMPGIGPRPRVSPQSGYPQNPYAPGTPVPLPTCAPPTSK